LLDLRQAIKRQLFIRNPSSCKLEVMASFVQVRDRLELLEMAPAEKGLYDTIADDAHKLSASSSSDQEERLWGKSFEQLRQLCIHPLATDEFQRLMGNAGGGIGAQDMLELTKVLLRSRRTMLARTREQLAKEKHEAKGVALGLDLVGRMQRHAATAANPAYWVSAGEVEAMAARHGLGRRALGATEGVFIRIIPDMPGGVEWVMGTERVSQYLRTAFVCGAAGNVPAYVSAGTDSAINRYMRYNRQVLDNRRDEVTRLEALVPQCEHNVQQLEGLMRGSNQSSIGSSNPQARWPSYVTTEETRLEFGRVSIRYGTKPAALLMLLKHLLGPQPSQGHDNQQPNTQPNKVIVFSMWDGVLQVIRSTVLQLWSERMQGGGCVYCEPRKAVAASGGGAGSNAEEPLEEQDPRTQSTPKREVRSVKDQNSSALSRFAHDPKCGVLFLSALSAGSGANLQCANHVVLLDPPGHNPAHGAALEDQAIGRCVRLGQERPVTVWRFAVADSVEVPLFEMIATSKKRASTQANALAYECQNPDAGKAAAAAAASGAGGGRRDEEEEASTEEEEGEEEVEAVDEMSLDEVLGRKRRRAEEEGLLVDCSAEGRAKSSSSGHSQYTTEATADRLQGNIASKLAAASTALAMAKEELTQVQAQVVAGDFTRAGSLVQLQQRLTQAQADHSEMQKLAQSTAHSQLAAVQATTEAACSPPGAKSTKLEHTRGSASVAGCVSGAGGVSGVTSIQQPLQIPIGRFLLDHGLCALKFRLKRIGVESVFQLKRLTDDDLRTGGLNLVESRKVRMALDSDTSKEHEQGVKAEVIQGVKAEVVRGPSTEIADHADDVVDLTSDGDE
jgi:hypothetical protein